LLVIPGYIFVSSPSANNFFSPVVIIQLFSGSGKIQDLKLVNYGFGSATNII
jgi:hypothetical protein